MRSDSAIPDATSSTKRKNSLRRLPLALTAVVAGVALAGTADAAQLGSFGGFGGRMMGGGGAPGVRGITTAPGASGMTGTRGITTTPGITGATGSRGIIGTTGPRGIIGTTGSRGGFPGTIGTINPTVKPPKVGVITGGGITGTPGITGNPGGKPPKGGGTTGGDGGRVSGGDDGKYPPRKPRHPKFPVIVGVPTGITAVTPVLGAVAPSSGAPTSKATPSKVTQSGGGGSSSSPPPIARRTGSGAPPANERRYVPDEVLIQLAASVPEETVDGLIRRLRLNRVASFTSNGVTMFRWRIADQRSVPTVIRSLEAERIVLAAQPNYLYQLQEEKPAPGDELSALPPVSQSDPGQYAPAKLRLRQAHELAKGQKVLVAVIDSGVDLTHPELEGMVAGSFDALDADEKAHAHGTGVAGAIVARARLTGTAPEARILAARAFSAKERTPEATTYSINRSIDWAIASGAHVINMSFAGPRDPSIEQKVAQARKRGLVLIAAAGNAGPKSGPLYPAAYPNVIAVTATDADDKLFNGANRGGHIAVAAPGVDLLLPAPETGYQVTTGTSFAAAEVSGIVALMLERKPDLGHEGVRKALTGTARDLGPKGADAQFGSGLVDAYEAIRSLEPATTGAAVRVVPAANR
jgi:Subtilase family